MSNILKFPTSDQALLHIDRRRLRGADRAPRAKTSWLGDAAEAPLDEETPREHRIRERQSREPETETGKNQRLRQRRYEAWQKVDTEKDYWKARMDFGDALSRAQRCGISDAMSFPAVQHEDRWPLLGKYREALARLLLTPAPTVATVNWKQAVLASGGHLHTSVESERLDRVIADDLAFLAAHPVRQSRSG
jgi:hypothetical protein